jgi:acetolactate decarboxylase
MTIMYYRRLTTILPGLVLLGCATTGNHSAAGKPRPWDGEVRVHGALRAMFHEGQTGAMVTLDTLLPNPDLYAVGALADLSGEVTVVGGKAYLSYPQEADATRTETPLRTNAAATLLVSSEVPDWRGVVTDRAIRFEELDQEIAKIAAAAGMNLDERFPFLMEGNVVDLQWHVIDGRRLTAGGASHQDHLAAAAKVRLDRGWATLVGFYSETDQGIFTHMGSKTHIHCALDEPVSTGHVDHVTIPVGTTIKFPEVGSGRPNKAMQRTGSAGR